MSAQICANCTAAYSVGAPQCPQCGANNPRADIDAPTAPALTVRCPGRECPAYGKGRLVQLRTAAPGVVERPALHCTECDRHMETVTEKEDQAMSKITVHGGASDATFDNEEGQSSPEPEAGTASSTSSERPSTSPETSESVSPKPARTTGSRSKKAPTGSSSATGTAGDPTAPTSDDDEG